MAIIEPVDPRQVDLEDWLREAMERIFVADESPDFTGLWAVTHREPRTDDMRQMIEDIRNAQ